MIRSFLAIFTIFLSLSAVAEPQFISIKDEAWKAKILKTIDEINQQLPESWQKPQEFSIAYVEGKEASYYPRFRYQGKDNQIESVEKLMVIGRDNDAIFFHEYAHLILDVLMRQKSEPWQYYITWSEFMFSDLNETLKGRQDALPSLIKINKEKQLKVDQGIATDFDKKALKNTGRFIAKYSADIKKITQALEIQKKWQAPLDGLNSFQALMPYHELFADYMAVVLLEDWQIMKSIPEKDLNNPNGPDIILPPLADEQAAKEAYLQYRDFPVGLTIESYQFKEWENDSDYWQFAPLRSQLRKFSEDSGWSKAQMIENLADSLLQVYESKMVPSPNYVDGPLKQRNLDLWQSFIDLSTSN